MCMRQHMIYVTKCVVAKTALAMVTYIFDLLIRQDIPSLFSITGEKLQLYCKCGKLICFSLFFFQWICMVTNFYQYFLIRKWLVMSFSIDLAKNLTQNFLSVSSTMTSVPNFS